MYPNGVPMISTAFDIAIEKEIS